MVSGRPSGVFRVQSFSWSSMYSMSVWYRSHSSGRRRVPSSRMMVMSDFASPTVTAFLMAPIHVPHAP